MALQSNIQEQIVKEAEEYKNKPHYSDGSALSVAPKIYLKRGYIAGATEYAEWKVRYDELKAENERLNDQNGRLHEKNRKISTEYAALKAKAQRLVDALELIQKWQMPPTGQFWDEEKTQPMSYSACYGSNGERDFIRSVANKALSEWNGKEHKEGEGV